MKVYLAQDNYAGPWRSRSIHKTWYGAARALRFAMRGHRRVHAAEVRP